METSQTAFQRPIIYHLERHEMPHIRLNLLQKCVFIFSMRLSSGQIQQQQEQNLAKAADPRGKLFTPFFPQSLWSVEQRLLMLLFMLMYCNSRSVL